jgi:DNA repair exonuclease SbcCD nuclease subunit
MRIVGDIHLDKRFPYTNAKTHQRWKALQEDVLNKCFCNGRTIQLGDVFDKYMVSAEDYVEAMYWFSDCAWVLAGNHDISNNTEKLSAVHLLENCVKHVTCATHEGINYIMVPHQLTQEKFEEALSNLHKFISGSIPNVLLLHCNYGDREGTQTENYLRPAKAKALLAEGIDDIVFGHEHNGGLRGSKVIAVGSILPMNFGEMTDKYVWDPEDRELIKVWDSTKGYAKWDYREFLQQGPLGSYQFIEVTGEVSPAEALAVKKQIASWYATSDSLIAIKDSTELMRAVSTDGDGKVIKQTEWESRILEMLTEQERDLFLELKNEVENPSIN